MENGSIELPLILGFIVFGKLKHELHFYMEKAKLNSGMKEFSDTIFSC